MSLKTLLMPQSTAAKIITTVVITVAVIGGGGFAITKFSSSYRLTNALEKVNDLNRQNITCEIGRESLIEELNKAREDIEELENELRLLTRERAISQESIQREEERLNRRIGFLRSRIIGSSCEEAMQYLRERAIERSDGQ